jgi:type IV pilus assembly protein PilQ
MTMTKRLRITVLCVGAAAGLGVAVALGLSTRPKTPPSAPAPPGGARLTATAHVVPETEDEPAATAPKAENAEQPAAVPLAQLPAFQGAYQLFSQQVRSLENAFEEFREHQDRRQRNVSQAISELQDQVAEHGDESPAGQRAAQQPQDAKQPPIESLPPAIERSEEDGKLSISLEDSDVREALKVFSQAANIDILASKNVGGTVTASLRDVDAETALSAILKTAGLVWRHEDGIVYVGTPADFEAMDQTQDRILMRVYRPNYIKAADLMTLITPMLSEHGKATVSAAAQVDIPSDQTKTGGNDFAGPDVVVVRDYEAILKQVDQLYAQVDINPRQVAIEAMIINVKLDDEYTLGVNWEVLRDRNNIRLVVGNPLNDLANLPTADGGLNFGYLDSSLSVFIQALESIGDTNVIASPRLLCLNKQRAEIQIGEQLGYVNTTVTQTFSTQSVSFLDVGTLLRIRPFIGDNGKIRMEVHPELSTGTVTVDAGLTLPNKSVTQVTTNVECDDGRTIVIGGLIREDLKTNTSQVPYLGNLPWVGPLFRTKTEDTERSEIIVLITPRIVCEPMLGEEGIKYERQFVNRHSVVFDKMSPIARRNYALRYQRLARAAFAAGDFETALRQIDWSIQFDSMNREAINLRGEIVAAAGINESIPEYLNQAHHPWDRTHKDYSQEGHPWRPEQMPHEVPLFEPVEDVGFPGPTTTIEPSAVRSGKALIPPAAPRPKSP